MQSETAQLPLVTWPQVPSLKSGLGALLQQLDQTQWWPADKLLEHQSKQLAGVVKHAIRSVPFYRDRLGGLGFSDHGFDQLDPHVWSQIPLLTRRDIQTAGTSLYSSELPNDHGPIATAMTSGSTGQPVIVRRTALASLFWRGFTIRDHLWHKRDFCQPLAGIRFTRSPESAPPHGKRMRDWGEATRGYVDTGPGYLLSIQTTVEEQARWLQTIEPSYLLSYPSAIQALAEHVAERRERLKNLLAVRTFGEIVEPQCRDACRRVWGVPIQDVYSSQEVGYLALQCPEREHYHVQSEGVLVEVLDDVGQPCTSGQVGRVAVTPLHNFAMPLLRYDIGDYAEVGEPCRCGRGLPVLNRILGRQRNMLVLPNGQKRWPALGHGGRPETLPPFYQFQVVQRSLRQIELRIVRPAPFSPAEAETVKQYVRRTLDHPFEVTIAYVDQIARSKSGKFEDFVCEVGGV